VGKFSTSCAAALALFALAVTACSSSPSPQERIDASERNAMAPLKAHYPTVVMGFDFHGTSVDVSIDTNAEIDLDDSQDAAMRREALVDWKAAWQRAHPGEHAHLTVRILNFRGVEQWKGTTKV
jgi:hypothetical protein